MPIESIWFPEGQGQTGRLVLAPAVKACTALLAYRRAEAPTNRSINRPATLAIMFSSLLAITIVQILMVFLRGHGAIAWERRIRSRTSFGGSICQ